MGRLDGPMSRLLVALQMRWLSALLACAALTIGQAAAAELPEGSSDYVFSDWDGTPLRVYTYRPANVAADQPIMIVMHGVERDADRYRDEWIAVAKKTGLIIAAPEFSDKKFPKSTNYNLGGLGKRQRENGIASAFDAIEPLFDDLRQRTGSPRQKYYLYGHSAGAQFVHRFVFAKPDARIETAFAANAGWYTMLQADASFPYGLKGSGLPDSTISNALSAPLVVLLGDADTDTGGNLRSTPEADAQGKTRLERGLNFFRASASLVDQQQLPFAWRLAIVPGAGHQNHKMAWGVRNFLANATVVTAPAD
jgi:poly(3-hydroxybutyrate) depolymerase